MSKRRLFRTAAVGLVASVALALGALPANAGDGDGADNGDSAGGYLAEVQADIVIDGESIPGGSASVSVSVPALCVWDHVTDDPVFFQQIMTIASSLPFSFYGFVAPNEQVMQEAIEIWDEGATPVSWYILSCGNNDAAAAEYFQNCAMFFPDVCLPSPWGYFVEEEEPPVVIAPEELALAAREYLEIPEPEVDRNPKVGSSGGATMVNLPTWFWVTNPDAVGGDDGELNIRASIPEVGVWAEITATTPGLSLASAAGSTSCNPSAAITEWSPGANDADGCTVSFAKASVAYPNGYPVTARTEWTATWVGGGPGGATDSGDLEPLTATSTVNVPVAEVQTIVR